MVSAAVPSALPVAQPQALAFRLVGLAQEAQRAVHAQMSYITGSSSAKPSHMTIVSGMPTRRKSENL